MHSDIQWIEAIAPDMVDMLSRRYLVLRTINWMAPVGRRLLAQTLGVSERTLRTETDTLRKLDLIMTNKSGMQVTQQGQDVLVGLSHFMDELMGIRQKERQLAQYFNIKRCIIVSGDSDRQLKVIGTMGEEVNQLLQQLLPEGRNIIAVMGGHTMEHVASHLTNKLGDKRDLLFVPARGGVGESVAIQANTIASQMAQHTGGKFRSLFVPEQVSERTYEPLLKEPSIQEVLAISGKLTWSCIVSVKPFQWPIAGICLRIRSRCYAVVKRLVKPLVTSLIRRVTWSTEFHGLVCKSENWPIWRLYSPLRVGLQKPPQLPRI